MIGYDPDEKQAPLPDASGSLTDRGGRVRRSDSLRLRPLAYADPMALPHPLPEELADLIAARFKLLGEPMRIKLLDRLRGGEASVQELAGAVGTTQQNVSKHLGALATAGVVARRKEGNFVYYRVVDDGIWQLCHDVCGSVERRLSDLHDLLAG
jgi:DNA-binding transcriptional ArsR family regulator